MNKPNFPTPLPNLSVALLHEQMLDKQGDIVTTSLTLIDVHDLARSTRTYGIKHFFVAHPSPALRELTNTLKTHWEDGFGSTYNPDRKAAFEILELVDYLEDALKALREWYKKEPVLIATSAKGGDNRISYSEMGKKIRSDAETPYLLMLGTGWGMSEGLMKRSTYTLDPITGPGEYNHLSVRTACGIMLDRIFCERAR